MRGLVNIIFLLAFAFCIFMMLEFVSKEVAK
jgi:hypothetical protein